jgi:adenylate cyclase
MGQRAGFLIILFLVERGIMSVEPQGELVPVGGGDSIPLIRNTLSIGRRESCDIQLPYPNVSGRHCELYFSDGYWYIRDLGSTNGTKVNGHRIDRRKMLKPKDEVTVGRHKFKINYDVPAGQDVLVDAVEEDMNQPLLEKAGLQRPKRQEKVTYHPQATDSGPFLVPEVETEPDDDD